MVQNVPAITRGVGDQRSTGGFAISLNVDGNCIEIVARSISQILYQMLDLRV